MYKNRTIKYLGLLECCRKKITQAKPQLDVSLYPLWEAPGISKAHSSRYSREAVLVSVTPLTMGLCSLSTKKTRELHRKEVIG